MRSRSSLSKNTTTPPSSSLSLSAIPWLVTTLLSASSSSPSLAYGLLSNDPSSPRLVYKFINLNYIALLSSSVCVMRNSLKIESTRLSRRRSLAKMNRRRSRIRLLERSCRSSLEITFKSLVEEKP